MLTIAHASEVTRDNIATTVSRPRAVGSSAFLSSDVMRNALGASCRFRLSRPLLCRSRRRARRYACAFRRGQVSADGKGDRTAIRRRAAAGGCYSRRSRRQSPACRSHHPHRRLQDERRQGCECKNRRAFRYRLGAQEGPRQQCVEKRDRRCPRIADALELRSGKAPRRGRGCVQDQRSQGLACDRNTARQGERSSGDRGAQSGSRGHRRDDR